MALSSGKISVYAIFHISSWKYFIKQKKHRKFGEEFSERYSIEVKGRGSLTNE